MIARRHPSALAHHPAHVLVNLGRGSGNLVDGGLVPRSGALDVAQGLLQTAELDLHLLLGLFGVAGGDLFEFVDGSQLLGDVVAGRLEGLEVALDLVDHGLVLQQRPVVAKVDRLGLFGQRLDLAAGVIVAFLEGGQGAGGVAAKSELGAEFAPVELGGCPRLD
jgi:hypothetical protein